MAKTQKERLTILANRAAFLRHKLSLYATEEIAAHSYTKCEMKALEWAIPILEAHIGAVRKVEPSAFSNHTNIYKTNPENNCCNSAGVCIPCDCADGTEKGE